MLAQIDLLFTVAVEVPRPSHYPDHRHHLPPANQNAGNNKDDDGAQDSQATDEEGLVAGCLAAAAAEWEAGERSIRQLKL